MKEMAEPMLKIPKKLLSALKLNGLSGRLLKIPSAGNNREILLVYNRQSSLESVYNLAVELSKYGNVSVPDLPGFGGMDSFYHIEDEPSIDSLAEYLAGFCKFHYRGKRLTVVGCGFGVLVITRMLQRFPDIVQKIDLVISLGGFSSAKGLKTHRRRMLAKFLSGRLTSTVFRAVFLNKPLLSLGLRLSGYRGAAVAQKSKLIRQNDFRTYVRTHIGMHTVDLTKWAVPVNIHHVHLLQDPDINEPVKRSFESIYKRFYGHAFSGKFVTSAYITPEEATQLLPSTARRILARKPANK